MIAKTRTMDAVRCLYRFAKAYVGWFSVNDTLHTTGLTHSTNKIYLDLLVDLHILEYIKPYRVHKYRYVQVITEEDAS